MKTKVAIAFALYYLLDEDSSQLRFEELKRVVSAYLGDEITDIEFERTLHSSKSLIEIDLQEIKLSYKTG